MLNLFLVVLRLPINNSTAAFKVVWTNRHELPTKISTTWSAKIFVL